MSAADPSLVRRWSRRAVSLGGLGLTTALVLPLLPAALLLAGPLDLLLGRRLATVRFLLLFALLLGCESWGLVGSTALWLRGLLERDALATRNRHHRLQARWARALWFGAVRLYGWRVRYDTAALDAPGPLLVFPRHVSLGDTLLPLVVSPRRWRYVLKRELLWDPCLDVVGQRLPNAFVARGKQAQADDLARVAALGVGLTPDEAVLLYPEGTRASPERRAALIARLERESPDSPLLEQARALDRLLPLRLGGPQALLDAAPEADVAFLGHVGLEGLTRLQAFTSGSAIGREIVVHVRRHPAAEVPRDPEQRTVWLVERWAELDAWVLAAEPTTG